MKMEERRELFAALRTALDERERLKEVLRKAVLQSWDTTWDIFVCCNQCHAPFWKQGQPENHSPDCLAAPD